MVCTALYLRVSRALIYKYSHDQRRRSLRENFPAAPEIHASTTSRSKQTRPAQPVYSPLCSSFSPPRLTGGLCLPLPLPSPMSIYLAICLFLMWLQQCTREAYAGRGAIGLTQRATKSDASGHCLGCKAHVRG